MDDSQNQEAGQERPVTVYVCGAVAASIMMGTVLVGILGESRQLWREGAAFFFSDVGLRLFGGACIAILSGAPYLMLASAARKVGPPQLFKIAAVVILVGQLCFMSYILFFVHSSTAAIGLLFMPLYLSIAIGAICVVAALVREFMPGRSFR
jgi:hypothetical protein